MKEMTQELKEKKELRNLTKHKILQDNVLVLPIDFEEDESVYTPSQYEDKPEYGMVISIGDGRLLDNGERVKVDIKEGDFIVFGKYSATNISSGGVDFLIVREEDIVSVYRE